MDRISMITALFARALAIKSIGGDSLSYIGVTTTALSDGATTNPITIDGDTVTATNGNVALYSGDAFVFNGTIWQASSAISQIFTEIGDLSDLDTEAKTDLVSAINEVNEEKQDNVELSLTPTAVVSDRDIQDGQGNTLSVLAEALTKTASGNPVVISDCAGGKARSLKTTINAIQDLHGLPFPYVGGAYKNKLPMTVSGIKAANTGGTWNGNVYAISNGTFEILTDTANNVTGIKVNGTFNSSVTFLIDTTYKTLPDMFGSGDFKLSQGIINTWTSGSSGLALQKQEAGSNINIPVNGTEISFSATGTDHYRPMLRFYSGESADNAVFLPMVRVSTESAAFAPYSNICPISGRTAVAVDDVGKNKVPMTVSNIKALNTSGTWAGNVYTVNNTTIEILTDAANNVIGIKTNTGSGGASGLIIFKLSDSTLSVKTGDIMTGCPTGGATNKYMLNINGTPFSDTGSGGTCAADATGTLNLDIFAGATLSNALWYPMIRDASAPSGFEPYAHSSATIQLGTTVYGADINWDTGVMTVTDVTIIKNGTETWSIDSQRLAQYGAAFPSDALPKLPPTNGTKAELICNQYETRSANDTYSKIQGISIQAVQGYLYIYDSRFTTEADLTNWSTWLSNNNLQICYKLATPTTIQLTPEQLTMLKGYNRVTIESGSIEVGYIAKAISGNDEEIAPLVGDKATKSYAVNDFIERNDGLYRVTASIASGASFTANNTVKMSIGEALTYLYNK